MNVMKQKPNRAAQLSNGVVILLAAWIASGCFSDLLKFQAPDRVDSGLLDGPENIPLLVNSAVGDFECAFAQYIVTTGQVSDEMESSNLASAEAFQLDRRAINKERTHYALYPCLIPPSNTGSSTEGLLTPIQTARFAAEQAVTRLNAATDAEVANRTSLLATANAYAGYSYVLLGESSCSAAVDGGAELTSNQIFGLAETKFTDAIAAATASGNAQMGNFALVGRARARLDMANTAGALTDASAMTTTTFVQNAKMSGANPRSYNMLFNFINLGAALSIYDAYRFPNFNNMGVADPRVPVVDAGRSGSDNTTDLWITTKFASLDAPIRIASYTEAQLIIAEVSGGQTAVDIINALHTANGLPPFPGGTAAEIQAQVVKERQAEFFLESHRFYDIRRLNVPLIPAPGTSFGYKGGFYGDMVCFPLPDVERDNNPTLSGS